MKYVISVKGKQYIVSEGSLISVDGIWDTSIKDSLRVVLSYDDDNFVSYTDKSSSVSPNVDIELVEHRRRPKIHILKVRRRKNSRKKIGYRGKYTLLRIVNIT